MAGLVLIVLFASSFAYAEETGSPAIPNILHCTANQTAGFHDFPNNPESYEPVAFFEGAFTLKVNRALMRHINPDEANDLFVTLIDKEDQVELTCNYIRGTGGDRGISCANLPPSELVLINTETLRYTRTSIGGWTFAGASDNTAGDSIYVEYGTCRD